jgi:hypothetical protein
MAADFNRAGRMSNLSHVFVAPSMTHFDPLKIASAMCHPSQGVMGSIVPVERVAIMSSSR